MKTKEKGIPASQFFKTSPTFTTLEVVRVELCECHHAEGWHADPDYDFEDGRYVKMPRPCRMPNCQCENFFQE